LTIDLTETHPYQYNTNIEGFAKLKGLAYNCHDIHHFMQIFCDFNNLNYSLIRVVLVILME
jgi:hypothetical protein